MKATGHALWLIPTGEANHKFSNLIRRLSQEYSAPIFQPHVTLVGEAFQSEKELVKKGEQLASGQKPFPITLRAIDYQDFYFRALYVKADKTEQLLAFYNHIIEIFEMQDIPEYMPHLSLLYGNFSQAIKERIIEKIGRDLTTEFTVSSVHLFNINGEADTWYRVKEIPFTY